MTVIGAVDVDVDDCTQALSSLPEPELVLAHHDSYVVRVSADHWVVIAPDDDRGPDWTYYAVPPGDDWGVTFESVGAALLRHFTR